MVRHDGGGARFQYEYCDFRGRRVLPSVPHGTQGERRDSGRVSAQRRATDDHPGRTRASRKVVSSSTTAPVTSAQSPSFAIASASFASSPPPLCCGGRTSSPRNRRWSHASVSSAHRKPPCHRGRGRHPCTRRRPGCRQWCWPRGQSRPKSVASVRCCRRRSGVTSGLDWWASKNKQRAARTPRWIGAS